MPAAMTKRLTPLIALVVFLLLGCLVVPARAETPVQIDISPNAVCALTDAGEIVCWGFDIPLVSDPPTGAFTNLGLGYNDGCAISTDGAVVCWGANYFSLRGKIDRLLARDPEADLHFFGLAQRVPPDRTDFVQVVVHPWQHYACARTNEGEIVCWGSLPPQRGTAPSGTGFVELINTGRGFCALDADGRTTCWGDLIIDQYVSEVGPFVRIAASGNGLCGITADAEVRCRVPGSPPAPGPPDPYSQIFRNVHVIGSQGCAVLDDGSLHCQQTHHWCSHFFAPSVEYCPADQIRFTSWDIPFTTLYEGGPDRETTAERRYSQLFGDRAACAITTEGHIDCWSDFSRGDPRHDVPERFRPEPAPSDAEPPAADDGQGQ